MGLKLWILMTTTQLNKKYKIPTCLKNFREIFRVEWVQFVDYGS